MAVSLGTGMSRRKLLGRLAKAGAAAALVGVVGRAGTRSAGAAGSCAYGPGTCQQGYVWREAYFGDKACVDPSQRDQAASDNANAPYRVDPYGAYGPNSCQQGYVWRDAFDGDAVCVEPWVRDQVAYDNSVASSRIQPGCDGTGGGTGWVDSDGDLLPDHCDDEPYTYNPGYTEPMDCISQG
jgi:hypothetical protein